MIGSDIINSLGGGSGINSGSIVEQLSEIEKSSKQLAIDNKRETFEAQVSDYGLLRSALATLQDAADIVGDPSSFNSKSATFTDSSALIPSGLEDEAPVGDYTFSVEKIARAQSLSTNTVFADATDEVGKGTLSFNFGSWDAGAEVFTENADEAGFSIVIDDSNNSLNGLRDAINAADKGVQASIINDGSGEKLVISAPSGVNQQLQITVDDDDGLDVDNAGLSRFAFAEGAGNVNQQMDQNQSGQDAEIIVNGLTVTRSSNSIDDVIAGFKFDLAAAAPGEVMTVSIFEDKLAAENVIRDFVDAYNAFLEAVEPLVDFNEETDEFGSLRRDATSTALMRNLRGAITAEVPEVSSAFTFLGAIGVRTELDGTMSINEDSFSKAFDEDFSAIQNLFAPSTSSSSDKIVVNSFGEQTVAGTYEVVITSEPEKGNLTGAAPAGSLLTDLDAPVAGFATGSASDADLITNLSAAGANDYDFTIDVDGVSSGTISLTPGAYADLAAVALEIETQINADATLGANDVSVAHNGTAFVVTSLSTGASSSVDNIVSVGGSADELGLFDAVATQGSDDAYDDAYDFTVAVNGTTSGTISITPGSYADEDALAAHMQSQINADSTLQAAGSSVSVTWNGAEFVIESSSYGASSSVVVSDIGSSAADLGLSAGVRDDGQNVAGTVDGKTGFGVGNVLLPELDSDPYGLTFIIQEGATDSTVTFSRGFGSTLSQLLEGYLESNGVLDTRISGNDGLNEKLDDLDTDQSELDRRMTAYTERLMAQFQAMERIVAGLNSSGSFLDGILDRLPFTAQN